MTEAIVFTQDNHIGLVTLNRPQALNALTFPMILALQDQLQVWQDDNHIHAVVVRAMGERAFCAGGDIRAIYAHGRENHSRTMEFFRAEYRLNEFIYNFSKPYIALMDGITMGGGVGISLHGSHPIASERFVFAMPETGIGFYPDVGASHFLSRCPGHVGVYLGLTGNRLGCFDAHNFGLVSHIISRDKFTDVLDVLIKSDLSKDAHQCVDNILLSFLMPASSSTIEECLPWIDACFQSSDIESILDNLNEHERDWHKETRRVLASKAPLSLKITLAQLQKAKSMTMGECLKMDYCLTDHFMRASDFYEGVRALLVDKDNEPHWHPERLIDVSEPMIAEYFSDIHFPC